MAYLEGGFLFSDQVPELRMMAGKYAVRHAPAGRVALPWVAVYQLLEHLESASSAKYPRSVALTKMLWSKPLDCSEMGSYSASEKIQ